MTSLKKHVANASASLGDVSRPTRSSDSIGSSQARDCRSEKSATSASICSVALRPHGRGRDAVVTIYRSETLDRMDVSRRKRCLQKEAVGL